MTGGFAFAAILAATIVPAQPLAETYAWPLDLPRELTSSFGEYRPGRYHMGIDLRTGPIGKDVHAAADGYVARIRCSPYGYGKAVYLQLADGNSAVYAHLNDFAPALRDYVRRAQHERQEYTVDLTPKPGEFPVKRGELIAKSGQTGIGVPHLHYELRDKSGVPINPRLLGVEWPDDAAPIIDSLTVLPLSPRSIVGNGYRGTGYLGVHDDEGRLRMSLPISIEGPVGFLVGARDPAKGGSSLGIYRVTLTVAGRTVFTVQNDQISYDHAEDGAIAFTTVAPLSRSRSLRLWRVPGNDAEAYSAGDSDGRVELNEASAEALIIVEDFAGHTASLPMELRRGEPEPGPPAGQQLRGNGSAGFRFNGAALVAIANFPGDEMEPPVLVVTGGTADRYPLRRMDARRFETAYLPDASLADRTFTLEHPRLTADPHRFVFIKRGGPARQVAIGDLEIATQPDSPYGVLAFEAHTIEAERDKELLALGPAYDVQPGDLPVDAPITLSLPLPGSLDNPKRALMYRRDLDKKKWVRQDTQRDGGRASTATRQLGVYALMDDATPPRLTGIDLKDGQSFASPRPKLRARVLDEGSGIDTWRFTYNGRWLLTEYDPEQDLLTWEQDEDLPGGVGTLVIEASDHAGNTTRQELALQIRERAR